MLLELHWQKNIWGSFLSILIAFSRCSEIKFIILDKSLCWEQNKTKICAIRKCKSSPWKCTFRRMGRHAAFPASKDRFDPGICWTYADVSIWAFIGHAIHLNAACPVPPSLYMKHRCNTEYLNVLLPSCYSLTLIIMALLLQLDYPAATYTFVHIKLEMNEWIFELYE